MLRAAPSRIGADSNWMTARAQSAATNARSNVPSGIAASLCSSMFGRERYQAAIGFSSDRSMDQITW